MSDSVGGLSDRRGLGPARAVDQDVASGFPSQGIPIRPLLQLPQAGQGLPRIGSGGGVAFNCKVFLYL